MITKNSLEEYWLRRRLECLQEMEIIDELPEEERLLRYQGILLEFDFVASREKLINLLLEIDSGG